MTGHFRFSLRAFFLASSLLPLAPLHAQGTHLWTQSKMEEFEKGTPRGVALTSDGRIVAAPGLTEGLTTPASFVWAVVADKSGTAYLGTGSPASILRLGTEAGAKPVTLFATKDVSVQSLALGPDGQLYAATLPSGKVFRIDPAAREPFDESKATVVFDPAKLPEDKEKKDKKEAHYVWAMSFDAKGRLYLATGGPAGVYRIDVTRPNAQPEPFFLSDEAHIRSLAWEANGNLIAGSDGSGLVYRIDPSGKGTVLFAAPRREVTAVAVDAQGVIYAACVGEKGRSPLPPLPVQGAVATGAMSLLPLVPPRSLQAVNPSTSLPEGSEIYALADNQAPRKLWSAKDEIVYALTRRADGLLALTGNRGHILRIGSDGSFADLAHLDAQQGLAWAATAKGDLLIGTGNPGKLFTLGATAEHEYASTVLDAGALARFGQIEVEPGASGYKLWTRSGNVEQPVRGWSEWKPVVDGAAASPAGRYFQWKATLDANGALGAVGVNFLAVNAAPVIDDLVVVPGARLNVEGNAGGAAQTVNIAFSALAQSFAIPNENAGGAPLAAAKDRTAVTARWAAHDANGDRLNYALYLRGDGESVWRLLRDKLTGHAYSFDATRIPDGGYQLKVVASDAPSHTPGEALTAEKISARFVVDTTPPVVSALHASRKGNALAIAFVAEDATLPLARAELSLDGGAWQTIEPESKLFDRRRLAFSFTVPLADEKNVEHLVTVRVFDRDDNVGLAKTVISAEAR
jgi:hypothetical protein